MKNVNTNVCTKELQIQSLLAFAKALDLQLIEDAQGSRWVSAGAGSGMEKISINTLIHLHNDEWLPVYASGYEHYFFCKNSPYFTLSKYMLNKANGAKIVKRVKGWYHKRQKDIVIQSDVVEFTDESYYELFLEPIVEKVNE